MLKPSAVLEDQRVDQAARPSTELLSDHDRIVALEEKVARLESLLAGQAALTLGVLTEPDAEPDPTLRL